MNEFWTVAGIFGHLAFWDARAEVLIRKLQRGEPFTESDYEPPDPSCARTIAASISTSSRKR